jgi:hypothetical protein
MKISGFSFVRNADILYYPIAESICSILPICDEFVIAVGKGDDNDSTREKIVAINDPKIRIIDTEWTDRETLRSRIYSQQTNIALKECTGDWCFYIQADEVLHERYLPAIKARCEQLHSDAQIEGLLFGFRHFWGDYNHQLINHAWYPREIRIIKNKPGIESIGDAQSFRKNNEKLTVAKVDATMYHYGFVRPPDFMSRKASHAAVTYRGEEKAQEQEKSKPKSFEYGSLEKVPRFTESHPQVLLQRISEMDWKHQLQYHGKSQTHFKHDRFKYRLLSWIEQNLLGGRLIFGYRNWRIVKRPQGFL